MNIHNRQPAYGKTPAARLTSSLLRGLSAGLLLLIAFIFFSQSLSSVWLESFDAAVGEAIRSMSSEGLTAVARFFTLLGEAETYLVLFILSGIFLIFRLKHTWETLVLFLCVLGAWGLNELLKGVFGRIRPAIEHLVQVGGFSFPSGHAMVSTSFYGLLGYIFWLNARERWQGGSWTVLLLTVLLVAGIGFSRIYLGVHYPSDVLAGFAGGGAWLAGCIVGLHAIRYYKGKYAKP